MSTTTAEVRERPILFSGTMVRAILEGRKTQTRRVLRKSPLTHPDSPYYFDHISYDLGYPASRDRAWAGFRYEAQEAEASALYEPCPYGKPGDRLWVRETWGDVTRAFQSHDCEDPQVWAYRADEAVHNSRTFLEHMKDSGIVCQQWRPSIFMPRWMSRITLEIESVRVERLQQISLEDIRAEGIEPPTNGDHANQYYREEMLRLWATGWDRINGKRAGCAWKDSPWVWVLTFKRK